MSFWGELKRRNVYKVGVAYAVVAWLIAQAVAIAFPALHLPGWTVTLVIALLIIGFPLILLFAWAFEITPEGIKRTKEVPLAESITHLTGQKLNYIVTGLLVLAVGFLLVKDFYLERRATEPEMVSTESKQVPATSDVEKTKKTIAVLPFKDLSPESDQRYFVDGLSEEILNSLAQIPDLLVTGRTSSFTYKGSNKKTPEIANELGVENILEGSVRKSGSALRITAQLLRGKDGFHLWSKTYDRELKDIFAVQENIATAVADELKATLGVGKSLKQLGGTNNLEAYELYLVAKGKMSNTSDINVIFSTLEEIDAAITLDPEFALAWAQKAMIHISYTVFGSPDRAAAEEEAALEAARKAIELEPKMAAGLLALGFIEMRRGDFIEAGLYYRNALKLTNEPTILIEYGLETHYFAVGYFKRCGELFEEALRNDPLNQSARGRYIKYLSFLGDLRHAEEEYEHAKVLFGDKWISGEREVSLIRLGSGKAVSYDDIPYSCPIFDVAKKYLESPEEGLAELRQIYTDEGNLSSNDLITMSLWAAYFGDPHFSMDAMEKGVRINASSIFNIWFPVFQEVRQLPRFKEFVREIGLVDYWNKFGWPDICHKLDNGDFECD